MSIVLAKVRRDSALLAVDTICGSAAGNDPGARWEGGKLLVIPHLNAAVAVAGNQDLVGQVYARIVHAGGDFDHVCNAVVAGGLVDEACAILEHLAAEQGFQVRGQQLVALVGFSPYLGFMRGLVAERQASGDRFGVVQFGELVAPPVNDADPASVELLLEIAGRQVEQTHREMPDCPIGGRLVVAELTPGRITTTAHEIPPAVTASSVE